VLASLWLVPAGRTAAQPSGQVLLRQLHGDLAFVVRRGESQSLLLGVGDSNRSIAVSVLARDLRRWADSATRILAARAPRRGQSVTWNAAVTGPGVVAGSMALTRTVAPGDTSIALMVTDTGFVAVRTTLTLVEARALVGAMRRAATTVLTPARKPD
jgi:hypothetical protein